MLDRSSKAALLIIASGVVVAGLYFFRGPLTQFALALILWFGIDGFARWLSAKLKAPRPLALTAGIIVVVGFSGLVIVLLADSVASVLSQAPQYEQRLNSLIGQAYALAGFNKQAPTITDLATRFNAGALIGDAVSGLRNALADALFVLIYLAFIIAAAGAFPVKIAGIFPDPDRRAGAVAIFEDIRRSIESYLWVQTIISLIITALTYATLVAIGLDNAIFWAVLIFFLNYIPTVGSLIATILPTIFAMMQFDSIVYVAATGLGVGFWQFVIGNFVQPRLMGESLNLSAIVVLLALALWSGLWGMSGAFLAAPLTVMLMLICAQFASSRWIGVLLSADGLPEPEQRGKNATPKD
jgi:predicted PurR-regulated permease PerM